MFQVWLSKAILLVQIGKVKLTIQCSLAELGYLVLLGHSLIPHRGC